MYRLVLLLVLWPAGASAQTTASISGTVTNAATGAPLFSGAGESVWVEAYTSAGEPYRQIMIEGTDGRYQMTVEPGTYYLRTRGPSAFIAQLYNGKSCNADDCRVTNGTPLAVAAGSTTAISFALVEGGRIGGTARRAADGTPVRDIDINVYNASTAHVRTVRANADGTYLATGIETGTFYLASGPGSSLVQDRNYIDEIFGGRPCPRLLFSYPELPCPIALGTPVAVTVGSTTSAIDFSLDPAARLSGTVKSTAGTAVVFITVAVFAGDTEVASTLTNPGGEYSLVGLPPGVYRVRTRSSLNVNLVDQWAGGVCVGCPGTPAAVALAAGSATVVDFTLAPGGTIAGSYTCCGGIISVYDTNGVLIRSRDFGGASQSPGGSYAIDGIPAGTYFVRLADPAQTGGTSPTRAPRGSGGDVLYPGIPCAAEDCDVRRGAPVAVRTGETTAGINFVLGTGGTIVGTVPSNFLVPEIYDARGVRLRGRLAGPGVPIFGPGNSFSANGLPPGVYYLRVVPASDARRAPIQLNGGVLCSDCPVTSAMPVYVRSGGVANALFIAASGRAIRGVVRDAADSLPLSSITVEIVTRGGLVVGRSTTDSEGGFVLTELAPGTYFARTRNLRGYVDEVYDDVACAACDITRGTPIVIQSNSDVSGIAIRLARGTILTGRVTTDSALALGGAHVSVFSAGGAVLARTLATALGEYQTGVTSGSHFARSEPLAGYRQELYRDMPCANGTCDPATGTQINASGASVAGIDFTLASCAAMTIAPSRLAAAAVGTPYRQTLSAAGGTAPLRFWVAAGRLPTGLALDASTGVLSGVPTTAGRDDLTVAAIDAAGCAATRAYALDVPACPFVLERAQVSSPASGANAGVGITGACGTTIAVSNDAWIRVLTTTSTEFQIGIDPNTTTAIRTGTVTIGPRLLTVVQAGTVSGVPFGVFETPAAGANVTGSVAVSGWTLDDVGIVHVSIFRDPVAGEPTGTLIPIGQTTFVEGARPDVEAAFPSTPNNRRAGWGYLLLTNMLPNGGNGTFRIHAYAEDAEHHFTLIGSKTINAANATATLPFGAIDTPAQGGSASGSSYINFGWALTPQPQMIPTDGSTIQVFIDGAPIGPLTQYSLFRSDVSTLFPGLKNSAGPVGYRTFDTTTLEEGIHTIAWSVTDDGGRAEGIGSRYFFVNNSAWTALSTSGGAERSTSEDPGARAASRTEGVDVDRYADGLRDLPVSRDVILQWRDSAWVPVALGDHGGRAIDIRELERVELNLAADVRDQCAPTFAGYVVANGQVRELPAGASIEPSGRFYWQPGPGFLGAYQLLFVRTACDGTRQAVRVSVEIR